MRSLPVVVGALLAACGLPLSGLSEDPSDAGVDAAPPAPAVDAGPPAPGMDAGPPAPMTDAGPPAPDAGPPPGEDAGSPAVDAGPGSGIPVGCGTTAFLDEGFETAFPGAFDGAFLAGGDDVQRTTSRAHNGSYSMACRTDRAPSAQATMFRNVGNRARMYLSMHVYFESGYPSSSYIVLAGLINRAGSWDDILLVEVTSDRELAVWNAVTRDFHRSTLLVNAGAWHHIEMFATVSDTAGRVVLALDGINALDLSGLDTGTDLIDLVHAGIGWQGSGWEPVHMNLDDVVLDDTCDFP